MLKHYPIQTSFRAPKDNANPKLYGVVAVVGLSELDAVMADRTAV